MGSATAVARLLFGGVLVVALACDVAGLLVEVLRDAGDGEVGLRAVQVGFLRLMLIELPVGADDGHVVSARDTGLVG